MLNAFSHRAKYLPPDLKKYWNDLQKNPRGCYRIEEFRHQVAAQQKRKAFDNEYFQALRREIKIKELGIEHEIGSWVAVLKRHCEKVAYAALKQGTLPHKPHGLLLPGHNAPWPESHEFLLERRYWTSSWRKELQGWCDDTEDPIVQETTDEFANIGGTMPSLTDWKSTAQHCIPEGITMVPPAVTATLPAQPLKANERAVHPDYCGKRYDELYTKETKNMTKAMAEWKKKNDQIEITIIKAETHKLCKGSALLQDLQDEVEANNVIMKELKKKSSENEINGKGFLSVADLEKIGKDCEHLYNSIKPTAEQKKVLEGLLSLPGQQQK